MKKALSALALVLAFNLASQAHAADLNEYLQDTALLPVRAAAIVSALTVTTPKRAARAGMEAASLVTPSQSPDTLIFEYAAVPIGFAVGALAGPFDGATGTINKAWDKPFSSESFSLAQ